MTKQSFKVTTSFVLSPADLAALAGVCRFDSFPGSAPPSQYLTADGTECQGLRATPGWSYAGVPFYVLPAGTGGTCPDGYLKVMRAYNGRAPQGNANYRLSTSDSTMRDMARFGWSVEGTAMCVRP